jgi:hypothetical protein
MHKRESSKMLPRAVLQRETRKMLQRNIQGAAGETKTKMLQGEETNMKDAAERNLNYANLNAAHVSSHPRSSRNRPSILPHPPHLQSSLQLAADMPELLALGDYPLSRCLSLNLLLPYSVCVSQFYNALMVFYKSLAPPPAAAPCSRLFLLEIYTCSMPQPSREMQSAKDDARLGTAQCAEAWARAPRRPRAGNEE